MTRLGCRLAAATGLLGVLATGAAGAAVQLITEAEAHLPPPADPPANTRGVLRGPTIRIVSPAGSPATVGPQPFWLRIELAARGGGSIDRETLKISYLRAWAVDITERLRPYATPGALEIPEASVPAGTHIFRIEVQDTQGRRGAALLELHVP